MNDVKSLTNKQRNFALDIIKLIASFFVVFIHVHFYGEFGVLIRIFGRFAVPTFFLTSGYFSWKIINEKDYKKIFERIKSLLYIFIFAVIIYSIVFIMFNGIDSYLSYFAEKSTYLKLFLLNSFENSFFTPLWFLPALIYCYLIIALLLRLNLQKIIYIFPLIFVASIIFSEYVIRHYNVTNEYLRNFFMTGLPYFSTGVLVKKNVEKINKVPLYVYFITLIASIILFFVMYFSLEYTSFPIICISISLFLITVRKPIYVEYKRFHMVVEKLPLYIYICHIPIKAIIKHFNLGINDWINPLIVLFISIIISSCYALLKLLLKEKRVSINATK